MGSWPRRVRRRSLGWLALALTGCLTADDRPEPGSLFLTAAPDPTIVEPWTTDDGWTVDFDRFDAVLGDIRFRNLPDGRDDCASYAETYYEWVYDFTQVETPQKVGLAYALGPCSVEFRLRTPSAETVLGQGAEQSVLDRLLVEASDPYAAAPDGVALRVQGVATAGDRTVRFDWAFRRGYELKTCPTADGTAVLSHIPFVGGEQVTSLVEVRGLELFRPRPDDEAPPRFDLWAEADLDGDGDLTIAELATAPFDAPSWDPADGEAPTSRLGLLYEHLLPRVPRLAGGNACNFELRQP